MDYNTSEKLVQSRRHMKRYEKSVNLHCYEVIYVSLYEASKLALPLTLLRKHAVKQVSVSKGYIS